MQISDEILLKYFIIIEAGRKKYPFYFCVEFFTSSTICMERTTLELIVHVRKCASTYLHDNGKHLAAFLLIKYVKIVHGLITLSRQENDFGLSGIQKWTKSHLKEQCHEVFDQLLLKRFDLGPIWTNCFLKFSRRYSIAKFKIFIFFNYCYWKCKAYLNTWLFLICERLQSFPKVSA